jgi:hypothetical protein
MCSKLVGIFHQIAPQLSELARNLEDIAWAGRMPIGDGQLVSARKSVQFRCVFQNQIFDDMSSILATAIASQDLCDIHGEFSATLLK